MSVLNPMLANALAIDDIPKKAKGYWMEPKLDGIRCVANWKGEMWSRSAKTNLHERVPHISNDVRALGLPEGTWLDGELGYVDETFVRWPMMDFNATMRVIGSGVDEALRKQKGVGDMIEYIVFDAVVFDVDWSQAFRSGYIESLTGRSPFISVVSQLGAWDESMYDEYVIAGGEGAILKNPSAYYVPGKRPTKAWYKIKKFDSFEGPIVDFDLGQGKYVNMIGALQVMHPNGTIIKCSGMTDTQRERMTNYWPDYQGHTVEVKYFGLTAGTPRHPQFLRMRPDLD